MPTYISLLNFTDQGIRTVKKTVQRAAGAAELAHQKYGCSLQTYWTVGPYDVIYILEAPDDESATAFLLEVGSRSRQDDYASRLRSRRDVQHSWETWLRVPSMLGRGCYASALLLLSLFIEVRRRRILGGPHPA